MSPAGSRWCWCARTTSGSYENATAGAPAGPCRCRAVNRPLQRIHVLAGVGIVIGGRTRAGRMPRERVHSERLRPAAGPPAIGPRSRSRTSGLPLYWSTTRTRRCIEHALARCGRAAHGADGCGSCRTAADRIPATSADVARPREGRPDRVTQRHPRAAMTGADHRADPVSGGRQAGERLSHTRPCAGDTRTGVAADAADSS